MEKRYFLNQNNVYQCLHPSLLNCEPCVLKTCSCFNVSCVLTYQLVLRAYVLMCQRALRAGVPTCFACSHANVSSVLTSKVPCVFSCSRGNVPCVLTCSRAHVPCVPCQLTGKVPCVLTYRKYQQWNFSFAPSFIRMRKPYWLKWKPEE